MTVGLGDFTYRDVEVSTPSADEMPVDMVGKARLGDFTYRDVEVLTPHAAEMPVAIVGADVEPAEVRVAKLRGRLIGAYHLVRVDEQRFAIRALGVCVPARRHGIGRWLLGHALGVAESRGGRFVQAPDGAAGFFRRAGFAENAHGLCFTLTQE